MAQPQNNTGASCGVWAASPGEAQLCWQPDLNGCHCDRVDQDTIFKALASSLHNTFAIPGVVLGVTGKVLVRLVKEPTWVFGESSCDVSSHGDIFFGKKTDTFFRNDWGTSEVSHC